MARDRDSKPSSIEIPCPTCERRWRFGRATDPTCPHCEATFSVQIHDEFALVERDGWTLAVSLSAADDLPIERDDRQAVKNDRPTPGDDAQTAGVAGDN